MTTDVEKLRQVEDVVRCAMSIAAHGAFIRSDAYQMTDELSRILGLEEYLDEV